MIQSCLSVYGLYEITEPYNETTAHLIPDVFHPLHILYVHVAKFVNNFSFGLASFLRNY